MTEIQNNSRKNLARSLRNGGYSYAEIQKFVSVPKSTLNFWLKDIELSEPQRNRLQKKQSDGIRIAAKNHAEKISREIEEINAAAIADIGKISKRELWLLGLMLYWKNKNRGDLQKGISFMSGDPILIRLFLKWLKEIGRLSDDELLFDIFTKKSGGQKVINFWSEATGYSRGHFSRVYRHGNRAEFGLLRIRVRASSMLARQIHGWIGGIIENL